MQQPVFVSCITILRINTFSKSNYIFKKQLLTNIAKLRNYNAKYVEKIDKVIVDVKTPCKDGLIDIYNHLYRISKAIILKNANTFKKILPLQDKFSRIN